MSEDKKEETSTNQAEFQSPNTPSPQFDHFRRFAGLREVNIHTVPPAFTLLQMRKIHGT